MNRNSKMLIVVVALCLIIGIGVAGTLMINGGSDAVGCEAQFDGALVSLYKGIDSEECIEVSVGDLPSHITVCEETEGCLLYTSDAADDMQV